MAIAEAIAPLIELKITLKKMEPETFLDLKNLDHVFRSLSQTELWLHSMEKAPALNQIGYSDLLVPNF